MSPDGGAPGGPPAGPPVGWHDRGASEGSLVRNGPGDVITIPGSPGGPPRSADEPSATLAERPAFVRPFGSPGGAPLP
jgi:hypothetical protein